MEAAAGHDERSFWMQAVREGKSAFWGAAGGVVLIAYGFVPTAQPILNFGRIYAGKAPPSAPHVRTLRIRVPGRHWCEHQSHCCYQQHAEAARMAHGSGSSSLAHQCVVGF